MPNTTGVYHAAYIAAAAIYVAYVVSLWTRARRVRERMSAARSELGGATAPARSSAEPDRHTTTPRAPG